MATLGNNFNSLFQDLRDAFKMFDRNKDGFIDLTELRKVMIFLLTFVSVSRGSP